MQPEATCIVVPRRKFQQQFMMNVPAAHISSQYQSSHSGGSGNNGPALDSGTGVDAQSVAQKVLQFLCVDSSAPTSDTPYRLRIQVTARPSISLRGTASEGSLVDTQAAATMPPMLLHEAICSLDSIEL